MTNPIKISNNLKNLENDQKREEEIMRDVLLLLENLIYREEITVKLILNCLYEIGSVNLINQRFQSQTLKGTLRLMSNLPKPVFRIIAWRWFKKNCPRLIAKWLQGQIAFKVVEKSKTPVIVENQAPTLNSLPQSQYQIQEVKLLRSQVKVLTGVLVSIITIFGGSFIWLSYSLERSHLQTVEELQTQVKTLEASINKR
ncbi:hypothetical protein [Halotia branconii]|uniref:Uncharacterized protein n=1 Tax=Halotia branconii CENA392 TaxID=1539056 RepID=A0AAJ6P8B8_9CYAN|nr:hypothetical protein [Halotia branconii]WGV24525.1 hypothetical protein QI031_22525 [Halotia branconii CENA392]